MNNHAGFRRLLRNRADSLAKTDREVYPFFLVPREAARYNEGRYKNRKEKKEEDPMTLLLSVSFALVCGLMMTRVIKPLKLPAVTAYLIAGVLIGPYCLGRLPHR